jgi:hypothetical protein
MRVSSVGLLIAFVIPLGVAGLVVVLLAQAGPHDVRLIGIPGDQLDPMAAATEGDAVVSEEQAVEIALGGARGTSDGRVLDTALGRYHERPSFIYSGRLVWAVSLTPDKSAPVFLSGGIGRDTSCDWAVHYDWVVATVDAETGEMLGYGTGASFDPSLPATSDRPGNSDRAYCERLFKEERRAGRSP